MRAPLLTAVVVAAAVVAATGSAAAATPRSSASPPVIHERFTALPCTGDPRHRTTIQLEGCAEHQVLRSDSTIDGLARTIDGTLPRAGRSDFVAASADWLAYRNAQCRAAASVDAGGSEASVVDVQCLATEDAAHIGALRRFLRDTSPTGRRVIAAG